MNSFSMLRRDQETCDRTREIMGLPEGLEWSDVQVRFGIDEPGEIVMTFIATGEQVAQLAELAKQRTSYPAVDEP